MKKRLLALILCVVMALGLVACGSSSSDTSSDDADTSEETTTDDATADAEDDTSDDSSEITTSTTVVVAIGSGFDTLDPGYVYEKYPSMIINACYETLFKFYSNDGEAEPSLAESYEFSDDNLTLTIYLHEEATFASGNPVEADDVVFSIMRCKNLEGNPSFICDTIESVEAVDAHTVVITLNQVDSAILSKLTYSSLAILDSEVVIANGGTDAEDAATTDTAQSYLDTTSAGSGMYIMTSYTQDEEIILEKNENYWGESTNVEKYIIKIQADSNTQMMTLASGDIDVAMNLTDDTMEELEGTDGVALINSATKTVGFIMMNMDEEYGGPVSDPLVQQAIRLALDYEGIQIICGDGTTTPYSLIQTSFMGSLGERSTDYQDIDAALELMAEAGYEDGFSIDLTVCDLDMEGVVLTDLAQKIKSDLAEINIEVNIVTQAWAAGYGDAYRDGTLGFTVMYWGIDYNDPNVQLAFLPGQTVGLRAGWTEDMNEELAALYDEAMAATDNDDRIAILEEIQELMYEDGPFIFIAQAPAHIGYNTRLSGVDVSDPYALDLTLINIVE